MTACHLFAVVVAAMVAGCSSTPTDSMALVDEDPRLTYANSLDPSGSGREGFVDWTHTHEAEDAIDVLYPEIGRRIDAHNRALATLKLPSQVREKNVAFARELREIVRLELHSQEVEGSLGAPDVMDGGVAEQADLAGP